MYLGIREVSLTIPNGAFLTGFYIRSGFGGRKMDVGVMDYPMKRVR
jgi:hypothetical protein